ncbi:MAG: hypothetical protein DDT19_01444 [Syntrophomonadaceae bacterium]|nr:hypothetical protein [Bacillota bacterium]
MEEEISLREMLEILFNGKWMIITVTAAAILISAVFTFFPKPAPLYRAEANMRIEQLSQVSYNPPSGGYFSILLATLITAESYSAETFADMVKHPDLINAVRAELRFDERGIPKGYLAKNIETSVDTTKTILTINFNHNDPEFVKEVVNAVLSEFRKFLAKRQRERIELVASNLERLVSLELQNIRTKLLNIEDKRAAYQPLITYREDSHLTPEYYVLSNDIARLISQIAQLEAEHKEIRNFRVQVVSMLRNVDDWVIFTPAASTSDVTPSPRKLNILIAAILGLMASTMAVFFINYWRETAPGSTEKKAL